MIHIFIINNYAGRRDAAGNIRKHLAERKDLRYFVFNTIEAGFETTIVKRILKYFEGEKLRFYCCGGSGTMRNMLAGFDSFENVEVAFFPCGLTNDFLKSFGEENAKFFTDIDNLIDGTVMPVDYIKTNYGVGLNTFSAGLDSMVVSKMEEFRVLDIFGSIMPYVISAVWSLLRSKSREYEVLIDGEPMRGKLSELIVGNGGVLGGNLYVARHTDVTDGRASYFVGPRRDSVFLMPTLLRVMNKRFDKLKKNSLLGECSVFEIRSVDGGPISMNLDGELVEGGEYWRAEIVNKGLNMVLPKEVAAGYTGVDYER